MIRLVAEQDLRTGLNLADGTRVMVTIWEEESNWHLPTPEEIVADWCAAARGIEGHWGRERALGYLIGEKFLNFLEQAETGRGWRAVIPAFVAEIKALFEQWQLPQLLDTPRRLGALGHTTDEEGHRLLRAEWEETERIRDDATGLPAFREHFRLFKTVPDVSEELGAETPTPDGPLSANFWIPEKIRRDRARLDHRIKTTYGFHALEDLVADKNARDQAREKLRYLM
jgi:hypothetical protein